MGMSINQFYDLTFKQWHNISRGYYRKIERETRLAWETARMIMYSNLLPHSRKNSNITPKSVLELPWDDDVSKEKNIPNEEEIIAVKKRWEERDRKLKNKTNT